MGSQIVMNKVKTYTIVAVTMAFVFAILYYVTEYFVGYKNSVVIAIVFSAVAALSTYFASDKLVLKISGARIADPTTAARMRKLLQPLCDRQDMPMPKLYMQDEASPNAFATGRSKNNSVICVTTGLMQRLDDAELQGVLAHELAHIKNYDMLLQTIVSIMVGAAVMVSSIFTRSMMWGGGRRRSSKEENNGAGAILAIVGIIFMILAPIAGQLLKLALSRNREYLADSTAAEMSGNPLALASALGKIGGVQSVNRANDATENLYIVNPLYANAATARKLFSTHPPIQERIARLKRQ